MRMSVMAAAVLAAALYAAPAAAQNGAGAAAPPADSLAEPRLVFDREVFSYSSGGRRDPFKPLTASDDGPLFDELTLRMIIFSQDPRESLVLVQDVAGKVHRLRRGERVGNATVVDIGRSRVLFSVNEFGVYRQGVLELKTNQGASR
ncbi:MAG: pilus assembly protein PilP [Candidatus Cloacimonetes bacterium]|jgi:hypothetical protein|nr:pilus assembly protein PilP [Candidatus Cloacimonadota bacterium]